MWNVKDVNFARDVNVRVVKYEDAKCAILEMCEMRNVWEENWARCEMRYVPDVKCNISKKKYLRCKILVCKLWNVISFRCEM